MVKSPVKEKEPRPMPPNHASHLLNPLRKLILSPKKLVTRLDLQPDAKVMELGPGPGYFSLEVARSIPQGVLTLVDIQPKMLEMARKRVDKAELTNVNFVQGDAAALPLPNECLDVVFMVAVLGEIPDKARCLQEIHRVLQEQGLLSITEQPGDPDFIPMSDLLKLTENAGFRLARSFGRSRNYTINLRKVVE